MGRSSGFGVQVLALAHQTYQATSPCSLEWSKPFSPQARSLWTELPPPLKHVHARNIVVLVLMHSGLGHDLVVQMGEKTGGCLP